MAGHLLHNLHVAPDINSNVSLCHFRCNAICSGIQGKSEPRSISKNSRQLEMMLQVIGDWVASHTQSEILAAMAEARVPSGALQCSLQWLDARILSGALPPGACSCKLLTVGVLRLDGMLLETGGAQSAGCTHQ